MCTCVHRHVRKHRWDANVSARYFLYDIHVSNSFMHTPTLSSALYLLMLRLMNRDYAAAFLLADSIITDAAFSPEEAQIFRALGTILNDCHPSAHACRGKIALAVANSDVLCPWDTSIEVSKYISKIAHVATQTRLAPTEEQQLVDMAYLLHKKKQVASKSQPNPHRLSRVSRC